MELPLGGLILILYMRHNHLISLLIALVTTQLLCTKVSKPFYLKAESQSVHGMDLMMFKKWSMIGERDQANLVVHLARFISHDFTHATLYHKSLQFHAHSDFMQASRRVRWFRPVSYSSMCQFHRFMRMLTCKLIPLRSMLSCFMSSTAGRFACCMLFACSRSPMMQ